MVRDVARKDSRNTQARQEGQDPGANGWVEQNGSETVSAEEWI